MMASVLKSGRIESEHSSQAEAFNFEDVTARARSYLDTVREQAAKILEDAKQQAATIQAQAAEQGKSAGQQALEDMANQRAGKIAETRINEAMADFRNAAQQLKEQNDEWLRQWQHETIPLAIAIAEKLVARQIDADSAILMDWIRDSVQMIRGEHKLQLRIHPETIVKLGSGLESFLKSLSTASEIVLTPDDQMDPHGLKLESAVGRLDMQLSSQLERLQQELE